MSRPSDSHCQLPLLGNCGRTLLPDAEVLTRLGTLLWVRGPVDSIGQVPSADIIAQSPRSRLRANTKASYSDRFLACIRILYYVQATGTCYY